jgi:hypothetical protein
VNIHAKDLAEQLYANFGEADNGCWTLQHDMYGFVNLDNWVTKEGITRFQGFIYYKNGGSVKPHFSMPMEILKLAKNYSIELRMFKDSPYLVWTVWFDKPVGTIQKSWKP